MRSRLPLLACVLFALGVVGCSSSSQTGVSKAELEAARRFEVFPLYWLGERFERWKVTHIALPGAAGFATFDYGTCTARGSDEPSCEPPLEIQVSPICAHLDAVARATIWKRRRVRNAPVGTIDSAPVLFTSRAQVKVYRGEGSDPGLALRALHALRSINRVAPLLAATGPILAPAPGVLEGTRHCSG